MSDPLVFPSATPRHALPMLFAGQAQKEVTVNRTFALTDVLLHAAVEAETTEPPEAPVEGQCWLVGAPASGGFEGRDGFIAGYQSGAWIFASPTDGMRVFDRSSGQSLLYVGGWRREAAISTPAGGATVDVEARGTINTLIQILQRSGILPAG